MLERTPLLDAFEARQRAEPPDIELARRLVEALFAQACGLDRRFVESTLLQFETGLDEPFLQRFRDACR